MRSHSRLEPRPAGEDGPIDRTALVSDNSVVCRNYDGTRSHEIAVTFRDADDEVAFSRTFRLAPMETVTVSSRLQRGVYRVSATLDDDESATADCLVGSGPNETALVETGNGSLSVAEGVL